MNKRLILGIVLFFFLFPSAFALTLPSNEVLIFWKLDSNATDYSGNGNDGTGSGTPTYNGSEVDLDAGDYILSPSLTTDITEGTVSFWWDTDITEGSTTNTYIWADEQQAYYLYFAGNCGSGDSYGLRINASANAYQCGAGYLFGATNGVEQLVTITWNGSVAYTYLDGVLDRTSPITTTQPQILNEIALGRLGTTTNTNNLGQFHDFIVLNKTLTSDNVSDLYNNGLVVSTTPPPASPDNETVETVTELRQDNPITVNSNSFQTVFSGTIQADHNGSAYTSTTIESVSTHPLTRTQQCRVTVDGTDYGSVSNRTMTPNQYGNAYLFSENFTVVANETYQVTLECRRLEPSGSLTINKSDTLVHFLYDEQGDEIPNQFIAQEFETNTTGYRLLFNGTFNTSSQTLTNTTRYLMIDGKIGYKYEGGSISTISLYAVVEGKQSEEFKRGGDPGTTGDGGGIYIVTNVTGNTSIPVQIWGKSTNADGSVEITAVIKEEISHNLEGANINITGNTVTSSNWQNISYTTIINSHSGDAFVVKGGISTRLTTGTLGSVTYRIAIDGQTSQEYTRQLSTVSSGVSIVQELFTGLDTGMYNVTLQAKMSTAGLVGTIEGGNVGAYLVKEGNPELNAYNVTLYDRWDNETLTGFTVINEQGTIFSDVGGVTQVFSTDGTDNLTIVKSSYFNGTVLNHNVSTNLNTSIFQAQLQMEAYKIITGDLVTPANFTIDGQTRTQDEYFYISAGTYNVTFSKSGWFSKTKQITVSALSNGTQNITAVSDTAINITATAAIGGGTITSFTINISNDNYSYSEEYTTTAGWIAFSALQNIPFNISINASGYALSNTTITPNATLYNYTFSLYTSESILFNLYDEVSGDLIDNVTMTIEIIGTYQSVNRTTSNGTLYVDLLTPDGYEIRYYSTNIDDYKLRSYFTDVSTQSFQQIDLYALNDTSTEITSATITFVVYDQDLDPVENARVTVSRYYIDENAFIQVFSRDTNTAGQAVGTFETIDAFYQYQVKIGSTIYYTSSAGGTQFVGTQTVPIYINLNTITFTTIQDFDDIPTTLRYVSLTNTTGYVQYNWSYTTSLPVCLYVDEVKAFGDGFTSSTCTTGASGSIQIAVNSSGLTKDYVAKGLINYNNGGYKVHDQISFTVNLQQSLSGEAWKDIATFIALFALIIAWFMGLRYPTVSIISMAAVFVILTLPPLRLIAIPTGIGMWVVAIAILLLAKAKT